MNKKRASSTVFVIIFFVLFLAFTTFAVDGTIIFTTRAKLQNATEQSALAGASEFVNSPGAVSSTAQNTFNILKADGLSNATATVSVDGSSKKVLVSTTMPAQPFFLALLGVAKIDLKAKACAVSEELPVTAHYTGVNWVNPSAAYLSDILSRDTNLNDTAIILPLGDTISASYASGFPYFDLIDEGEDALSLGPGGFVTIKLPAPILDKPGYDLHIKEAGFAKEGYMVFAGLDVNPDKPYVQHNNQGDGIKWINMTCTATPSIAGATDYATTNLGASSQQKVYGSAYFDIGAGCLGDVKMAKYIRIIDDNEETAYINGDKKKLYGEASTATAGADIEEVRVLNHVKLIKQSTL